MNSNIHDLNLNFDNDPKTLQELYEGYHVYDTIESKAQFWNTWQCFGFFPNGAQGEALIKLAEEHWLKNR